MNINKIYNMDCLDGMKQMDDNSVDTVITDPPYGISFMGKKWDYDIPSIEIWKECLRVLKPGGFLLSFAGTRTQHRMACNIEDAGFEIRDMICWLYGCLSEDTEILTLNGWKHYNKLKQLNIEQPILIYDLKNDIYKWEIPEKWNEYKINDTCYRIKSDSTDQLVSRNHRCLVEREGKLIFKYAETLECKENIPFLENLPTLPTTISDVYKGTSNTEQILPFMSNKDNGQVEFGKDKTIKRTKNNAGYLSNMRNKFLQTELLHKKSTTTFLFKTVQWKGKSKRTNQIFREREREETTWNRTKWFFESCLEGGSNLSQEERELWKIQNQIYSLPEEVYNNGSKGWLYNGTPIDYGKTPQPIIATNRSSPSYRPQSREQQHKELEIVQNKSITQKVRGYAITEAEITKIKYSGMIFCPTVSTGCFVARRNGKIFITGNSGFPKSLNISKAIDKMKGAEREIIGQKKCGYQVSISKQRKEQGHRPNLTKSKVDVDITIPSTPEAKLWDGYGTALKPAMEPITIAMKPFKGTFVDNALEFGVAGLNIDGGRIPLQDFGEDSRLGGKGEWKTDKTAKNVYEGGYEGKNISSSIQGRYPANIILDEESARLLDQQAPRTGQLASTTGNEPSVTKLNQIYGDYRGYANASKPRDKLAGASRFFYTAKASKTERNKGCKELPNKLGGSLEGGNDTRNGQDLPQLRMTKNHHPTVKPVSLIEYLCKLTRPPTGGIVLDPFIGSGTTAIACKYTNRDYIGFEKDPEYYKIAKARIKSTVTINKWL